MYPDDIIAADPVLQPMPTPLGGYVPSCVVTAAAFSVEASEATLRRAGYAACFRPATSDAPPPRDFAGRMLAGHWPVSEDSWTALYLELFVPALRA